MAQAKGVVGFNHSIMTRRFCRVVERHAEYDDVRAICRSSDPQSLGFQW